MITVALGLEGLMHNRYIIHHYIMYNSYLLKNNCLDFCFHKIFFSVFKDKYWFWSDGTPFHFSHWCKGQPDNYRGPQNCLKINHSGKL